MTELMNNGLDVVDYGNPIDPQPRDEKWSRLHDVMELVCNSDGKSSDVMDDLALRAREIIVGNGKKMEDISYQYLEDCFNSCEESLNTEDNGKEFELIQAFVKREQDLGRERRKITRQIEAKEEKRLAADIAELKGFRLRTSHTNSHEDLQQKTADAERSYFNRKMVVAKAAQVANAECRLQFTRVREFFDSLHETRKETLRRQFKSSLKLQGITHRLRNTDPRVAALERQIINRLYHKKKTDLNELHMTQNMEEAIYLESMVDLLFKVQTGKETAARELFELHVKYLKEQRHANMKRFDELSDLRAHATIEMAKVLAHYTEEEDDNVESEEQVRENVDAMERRKDHNASIPIMSVSQLYDTVLWSVATTQMSTTEGSTLYSSDFGSEEDYGAENNDDEEEAEAGDLESDEVISQDPDESNVGWKKDDMALSDTASTQGSTCDGSVNGGGTDHEEKSRLSSLGKIHVKQLSKEFRTLEKELVKKHESEIRKERRQYRAQARALKRKHQKIVDGLLQKCLYERHNLRESIAQRMRALENKQLESTKTLRKIIEEDIKVMQEALRAENQRLEDTEKNSFIKAQELISSQVFHEVRNALSSMISMSEITSSLKHDASLSPTDLVCSVDDMLDQIKEVVQYSLNMLNNILDVSKINSGSFNLVKKPFDLQELVAGATRMQLAKAGKVKMSFVPYPEACIANTDNDLVVRIVTNFISNAIKFTSAGAIQPFVWSLEEMFGNQAISSDSSIGSNESIDDEPSRPDQHFFNTNSLLESKESRLPEDQACSFVCDGDEQQQPLALRRMRLFAVGVADTGRGLSKEILRKSEKLLANSDSDSMVSCVRNSGFGLHLAHLLARALGTKVHISSLEQCRHLLNDDMLRAMEDRQQHSDEVRPNMESDGLESVGGTSSVGGCSKEISSPGSGTVIFITIPILKNDSNEENDYQIHPKSLFNPDHTKIPIQETDVHDNLVNDYKNNGYKFCPRPSDTSVDGTFRILVADDVTMLRKGLVHGLTKLFQIPVSIYTACTAEDVLRATSSEPFDLVICDNQFLFEDTSNIKSLPTGQSRPCLSYDSKKDTHSDLNKKIKEYFAKESFTVKDGDGELSGFEALRTIATSTNPRFPTPVLVLLSGHKWENAPSPGVIIVQKPLNQSGFVPLLESRAMDLLYNAYCIERNDGNNSGTNPILVNRHGSQLFVAR